MSEAEPQPDPVRRHRVLKTLAVVLAVVLVAGLVAGFFVYRHLNRNITSLDVIPALGTDRPTQLAPKPDQPDKPLDVLLIGSDTRTGQGKAPGGETPGLSDTTILMHLSADRKLAYGVSLPRDAMVDRPTCDRKDGEGTDPGGLTQFNEAYAVGGPACTMRTVEQLTGIRIEHFVVVDFKGFKKMVDALGGVEVCSTTPLEDYELGTVLPTAGRQMVDGHTALQYVRARQVTTETNGDYGRIKRQQLFLSSLLRSLISKDTFFSLSKLNNVVNMFIADSYVDNIDTKDLVDLGQSVQGVNAGRITFVTVPTVGYADEYGNETPRMDDMRALFDAIINDDPLPEEKPADDAPPSETQSSAEPESNGAEPESADEMVEAVATDPTAITVRVSNSTGEDGLATTAATELQNHGFNTVEPDDYPGPLDNTTVFFSAGNEEAAATVASSFSSPTIERVSGMGSEIRVVLGSDFASVAPPTPSGLPVQVRVLKDSSSEPTHLPEDLTVTNAADTTCE